MALDLTLYLVECEVPGLGAAGGDALVVLGRDAAEALSIRWVARPSVLAVQCSPLSVAQEGDAVMYCEVSPEVEDTVLRLGRAAGLDIEAERFDWTAVLDVLRGLVGSC